VPWTIARPPTTVASSPSSSGAGELSLAAVAAVASSVFLSVGGPHRVGGLVAHLFRPAATSAPTPAPRAPSSTPAPTGQVVDGVELGVPYACAPAVCEIVDRPATAWLDKVAPGHAPVKATDRYDYRVRDTNGDLYPYPGSAQVLALVMRLGDGTERATLVVCGADSCWQADPFRMNPPPSPLP
jgi:hypothetical protein